LLLYTFFTENERYYKFLNKAIEQLKKKRFINTLIINGHYLIINGHYLIIDFLKFVQNKPSGCVKDIKSIKIY